MAQRDPIKRREYQRKWRLANKDKINAYHKLYRKQFPEKVHVWDHKNRKAKQLWAVYRIRKEDYDRVLAAQENTCAICHVEFTKNRMPHVDHCHETGKLRGLLCPQCNTGIGQFQEEPVFLTKAAFYLLDKQFELERITAEVTVL